MLLQETNCSVEVLFAIKDPDVGPVLLVSQSTDDIPAQQCLHQHNVKICLEMMTFWKREVCTCRGAVTTVDLVMQLGSLDLCQILLLLHQALPGALGQCSHHNGKPVHNKHVGI